MEAEMMTDGCENRARTALVAVLLVSSSWSCGPGPRTASGTLLPFMEAVQSRDLEGLYCLCVGASASRELGADSGTRRAKFRRWAEARLDGYLVGRDEGWVELDESGIPLVKLFALGRGTYYTIAGTRAAADDALLVRTPLRFGYEQVDLSRLSPGTTFYLSGVPAGRVHSVRVPSGPRELRVEVLDSITVEWTLVRSEPDGDCPGRWTVAAAVPVAGSEVSREITWVF